MKERGRRSWREGVQEDKGEQEERRRTGTGPVPSRGHWRVDTVIRGAIAAIEFDGGVARMLAIAKQIPFLNDLREVGAKGAEQNDNIAALSIQLNDGLKQRIKHEALVVEVGWRRVFVYTLKPLPGAETQREVGGYT